MDSTSFIIVLVDPVEDLCSHLQEEFAGLAKVRVENGYFQDIQEFDCMVSPANSFGLMDGGVDLAIINFFGFELMDRVQEHIISEYRGEQPVGTSFIIRTDHPKHPFLAHTPTMRVPMTIADTDNVYRAMQAMLLAVWKHNIESEEKIKTVACPGLGTSTGGVPFRRAAKQMALAYKHFLNPPKQINWLFAKQRQMAIGRDGDK